MVIMGEQMERAKAIIDSIPPEGACVVALTNDIARRLKQGIRERLGKDMASKCRTIGIHRPSSIAKLMGERRMVILDCSFEDHAVSAVKAEVHRMAVGINAQHK